MRSLQRRRIIERPRLSALLDESTARVRTLVAPAGYGKTTLAEQWVAKDGCRSAWYTARQSSVDVAALALGIARAASSIVEGCDARLREHLRAVSAPAGNVSVLAEILGEDLEVWPDDAWLVVDDYQELASAREAESFVGALVAGCPLQFLLASRQRPSWITTRSILYGEVLELNQTQLAMDTREASEVLADWSGPSASGLVAVANGWPAVIGLASVSSAEIEGEDAVPESLYRFFAEEVFDALGDDVRTGLATLAVAPVIDVELARELLGQERADDVCTSSVEVGILVERNTRLDLHPLARAFLEEERRGAIAEGDAVATCLSHYKRKRDWDAAFDVIVRRHAPDELEQLLLDALDELLETARLSTIETWCDHAVRWGLDAPAFSLARAEIALREGRHPQAQAFAEAAAVESDLTYRALSIAGRSAHLASREEEALELYRRAEAAAPTEPARRDALWGQLLCEVELELPDASATLSELSVGVGLSDPREFVRAAAYRLGYGVTVGSLDLRESDVAYQLLNAVDDPLVESAFQSIYSHTLALAARYEEALAVAHGLLDTARRYRLDFAVPYGFLSAAMAHAGLRSWPEAALCLDEASAAARTCRNLHAEQSSFAVRLRVLTQQGRNQAALALPVPEFRSSMPAIRAESFGSRALVLASAGRVDEAEELVNEIRGSSRLVEAAVLVPAVEAIVSLRLGTPQAIDRVSELEEAAFSTGGVDLLVTAYRSVPELLAVLLKASRQRERVVDLVRRARDGDLAGAVGRPLGSGDDPRGNLSPREREVYELLRQGLSNRQIAEILFIEESTVKVHAHHIYDKVGIRSRTALAVQAALERGSRDFSDGRSD